MDNEFKELEDALKELTPKQPSHGMRWNLAQRLSDLETAQPERSSRPRLMILASAASILVVLVVWLLVVRGGNTPNENPVVKQDPKPESVYKDAIADTDPKVPASDDKGMEFVGDEDEYPATIAFEIRRHITAEQDLGIVRIPDQPPMRKVRREYVRELLVNDPETGKSYRVQKPESETILIRLDDQ